ncbi:xanthine dehydrogenase family protein molybdopterin-binding subunit [Phenylobacterium sp.]|jgi:xanthine dehydrogenase YagR molybdenum-binding subunit|uniref:xanthine dehydrogenase family protein molybdopterin-binding subunit n=1 Tax=Phenylobacterium sp. TaxID=1871053 RepID=UPI002E309EB7|nr:xanthine dehydrogenase family protein molybdopterin-binding subunit [Phenylobacterium sp.]HEX3365568.1 xanthine dehydrogenase family protein molybdopterin-binding subunit [Phenylobacterium sp.]
MADDTGHLRAHHIGQPATRIEGALKVTGQARFASDEAPASPAYAVLVTSAIARGRIRAMHLEAARAVPGVLDILTHANVGSEIKSPIGPDGGPTTTTLETDRIWHDGQIIGIVLADSIEAAQEAADKVVVDYEAETPSATFDSPGAEIEPKKANPESPPPAKGDAAAAFASAAVKVDARYSTPTQHHNPMELFTTTCVWEGPRLIIYEPTQSMYGLKGAVARQLSLDLANVRTISRYVGGGFGSRGTASSRTAWIAVAARRLKRPVKLMASRADGFTIVTYRAETRHHVQLGADRSGKLVSVSHEGREITSRPSKYNVAGTATTARMYASPNIATKVSIVHADRNTPGFMRAPPDTPYMFALECGMDELAYALDMDPVELRRINDTQTDPVDGLPFSSRSLMKCFDQAAARFDWAKRNPKPASMRDGDWLIGLGCATSCYPSNIGPAAARLSLTPQGKATIQMAGHEIGTGAYTVVAITVADKLGLALRDVTVLMGDSDLPPVPGAGGSNNAASTTNAAAKACEEIRSRLAVAAVRNNAGPFAGADPGALRLRDGALVGPGGKSEPLPTALARVAGGALEVHVENVPAGLSSEAAAGLYEGKMAMSRGTGRKDVTAYAFGAHFIEVRVHGRTREIRTPRIVSAFAAGTIVNPLAAYSQFMGGAIWGVSSALHEATEIDPKTARYVNTNLADYLVPVNADIGQLDVIFVPEEDPRVNPLGVKGIGEIGIVGMNAAVANAVFHATGKRIRDLPIRIEDLL